MLARLRRGSAGGDAASAAASAAAVSGVEEEEETSSGGDETDESYGTTPSAQRRILIGDRLCLAGFLLVFSCLVFVGSLGIHDFFWYSNPAVVAAQICRPLASAQLGCAALRGNDPHAVVNRNLPAAGASGASVRALTALRAGSEGSRKLAATSNAEPFVPALLGLAARMGRAIKDIRGILDPTAKLLHTVAGSREDASEAEESCGRLQTVAERSAGARPLPPQLPAALPADASLDTLYEGAKALDAWAAAAVSGWKVHCEAVAQDLRSSVGEAETFLQARVDGLVTDAEEVASRLFQQLQQQVSIVSEEAFDNLTTALCPEVEAVADNVEMLACQRIQDEVAQFLATFDDKAPGAFSSLLPGFVPASVERALWDAVTKQLRALAADALLQLCNVGKNLEQEALRRLNCSGRIPAAGDMLWGFVQPLAATFPTALEQAVDSVRSTTKALAGEITSSIDSTFAQAMGACAEVEVAANAAAARTRELAQDVLSATSDALARQRLATARSAADAGFAAAGAGLNDSLGTVRRAVDSPAAACASSAKGVVVSSRSLDLSSFSGLVDTMAGSVQYLADDAATLETWVNTSCDKLDEFYAGCVGVFESSFEQPFARFVLLAVFLWLAGAALTLVVLRIIMVRPICIVWMSFWSGIVVLLLAIVTSLIVGNLLFVAILAVIFVWRMARHCCCRGSIKSSGRLIGAAVAEATRSLHLSWWLLGLGIFAAQCLLLALAGGVLYRLSNSAVEAAIGDTAAFALLLFALMWSLEVVSNVYDVTISCVCGHDWGLCTPADSTEGALRFSLTMLGTICRGSLWIALLKALQYVLVRVKRKAEEKNPCNPAVLVAAVCACFCLEEIMQVCNSKAFVFVGIEGRSYTSSLGKVRKVFRPIKSSKGKLQMEGGHKKLTKAMIFNSTLDEVLDMAQWLVMYFCGGLSLLLGYKFGAYGNSNEGLFNNLVVGPVLCLLIAFFVTYALMLTMERLVEACACTLFVVLKDGVCEFRDDIKKQELVQRLPEKIRQKFDAASSASDGDSASSSDDRERVVVPAQPLPAPQPLPARQRWRQEWRLSPARQGLRAAPAPLPPVAAGGVPGVQMQWLPSPSHQPIAAPIAPVGASPPWQAAFPAQREI